MDPPLELVTCAHCCACNMVCVCMCAGAHTCKHTDVYETKDISRPMSKSDMRA